MNKIRHYAQSLASSEDQKNILKLTRKLVEQMEIDEANGGITYETVIIRRSDDVEDQSSYVVFYEGSERSDSDSSINFVRWESSALDEKDAYLAFFDQATKWFKEHNEELVMGDLAASLSYKDGKCVVRGTLYY